MIQTALRTLFFYILLIICMRLMGKRQVGELQPSELVTTFMISELATISMQDLDNPALNGVVGIFVIVTLELLFSLISMKSSPFRRLIEGKNAVIISHGVIDQKLMKKLRYSLNDLFEALRAAGCFNLGDVDYAILETDGTLSVLYKSSARPPSAEELGLALPDDEPTVCIINDGKINEDAVRQVGRERIAAELSRQKLAPENIFLMNYERGGFITVKKEKK